MGAGGTGGAWHGSDFRAAGSALFGTPLGARTRLREARISREAAAEPQPRFSAPLVRRGEGGRTQLVCAPRHASTARDRKARVLSSDTSQRLPCAAARLGSRVSGLGSEAGAVGRWGLRCIRLGRRAPAARFRMPRAQVQHNGLKITCSAWQRALPRLGRVAALALAPSVPARRAGAALAQRGGIGRV